MRLSSYCLIFIAVFPAACSRLAHAREPVFHAPLSLVEQTLDEIIRTSVARPDLFPIVLQNPAYDLSKTKEYEQLFTAAFVTAWRKYEEELVQEHCAGKYISGKPCGYEYPNPTLCGLARPIKGPSIYRTLMGDDLDAYVSVVPTTETRYARTYYLRHEGGRWKLGGFYCDRFDPDFLPAPTQATIKKFRQPRYESEKKLDEILRLTRSNADSTPFVFDLSWRDMTKDHRFFGMFTPAFLSSAKEEAGPFLRRWCSKGYVESGKWGCHFPEGPVACELSETELWTERTTREDDKEAAIVYSDPDLEYIRPEVRGSRFGYRMKKDEKGWKLGALICEHAKMELTINIP